MELGSPPLDGARLVAAPQQGVRTHRGQLYLRLPSPYVLARSPLSPPPWSAPARLLRRPRPLAPFLLVAATVSHDPPPSGPFISHIHLLPFSNPIFRLASVPLPFVSERVAPSYVPSLLRRSAAFIKK
jgi:hypothetical protein